MTLLRRFDRAYEYAVASSAGIRVLPIPRGLFLALSGRAGQGWYARLGPRLYGLGRGEDGLTLWIDDQAEPVSTDMTALVNHANTEAVLRICRGDELVSQTSYRSPRLGGLVRWDPTNDETQEDLDFGTWLSHTLGNRERLEHLGSVWAERA